MWDYIQDEHRHKKGVDIPDKELWTFFPCRKEDPCAVKQKFGSNDCGVYCCLFMDLLMTNIDPSLLCHAVDRVSEIGRVVLWQALQDRSPVFDVKSRPGLESTTQITKVASRLTYKSCREHNVDQGGTVSFVGVRKPGSKLSRKTLHKIPVQSKTSKYLHLFGTQKTPYIEELAYHYFYSSEQGEKEPLKPMPPPRNFELQEPKLNDGVVWKYDPFNRTVLADFSEVTWIHSKHKTYLSQLMERDDITVISRGLVAPVNDVNEFLEAMKLSFGGGNPYHNFRRFDQVVKNGYITYREHNDGHITMTMGEYVDYLMIRTKNSKDKTFRYANMDGTIEIVDDATAVVFYLLDLDLTQYWSSFNNVFRERHKLKEILPAGEWCMLSHVSWYTRLWLSQFPIVAELVTDTDC